ncbi:MAG: hypothetical protein GY696_40190 [Gammaproteobacteria bacterium]|nr:hypothetical protein [Gammaproteobacteria bacterium]
MRINKIYTTVLLIVIVVAPIYWLLGTEDGKRRSDTLILWVSGGDPIDINFKALDDLLTEKEWKNVYPDIAWKCGAEVSTWGTSLCTAEISSYNGIPAKYVTVFFVSDYASGLKLAYREQYHQSLGKELQYQLGRPDGVSGGVVRWKLEHGVVLLKQLLEKNDEAALLWVPGRIE